MNTVSSRTTREREARRALEEATRRLEEATIALDKLSMPVSPGRGEYRITVQFEMNGPTYTFLMLINRLGRVNTTAVADGGQFASFEAFVEWLRGKDAYKVSPLRRMVASSDEGIELV